MGARHVPGGSGGPVTVASGRCHPLPKRLPLPAIVVLCLAALLGLAAWLVPWASHPVGFDVFRSLLIARTWAEQGFPSTLPAAAFTGLDDRFADQQLTFDWLLALCGGHADSTRPRAAGAVDPVRAQGGRALVVR